MRWHRSLGLIVTAGADFRVIYVSLHLWQITGRCEAAISNEALPKGLRMGNQELSERWDSISIAIRRIIKRVEQLPEREQDSEINDWLQRLLDHSESRADALIDPV